MPLEAPVIRTVLPLRLRSIASTLSAVVPAERSESRDPYAAPYREGTGYGSPLSRGRRAPPGSLIDFEHFAGKGGAHDLGGTAGDEIAARASPHRLDRQFGREAGGAMELHAAVGRLKAQFGAMNLRHIGVVAAGDALVDLPGGAMGQELAGLIFGVELGDRELHRLALGDRLAKSHPLLRIFADHFEAPLRHAEPVRRLMHAVARDPRLRL